MLEDVERVRVGYVECVDEWLSDRGSWVVCR